MSEPNARKGHVLLLEQLCDRFEKALRAEVRTCLALMNVVEGRTTQAIESCEFVLAKHSEYRPALLGLALARFDRGELTSACDLLAEAVSVAPPSSPSQLLRAELLMALGRKKEAAALLAQALGTKGPPADLYSGFARCVDWDEQAAASLQEAQRRSPTMALPHFAQAEILLRQSHDLPLGSRPYAKVAALLNEGFDCLTRQTPKGCQRSSQVLEDALREAHRRPSSLETSLPPTEP